MSLINLDQETVTLTTNLSGNFNLTGGATYTLKRINNMVYLYCKMNGALQTGTVATFINLAGAIPIQYRPQLALNFPVFVLNNSAGIAGDIAILSNGIINIHTGYAGAFGTTTGNGFLPINVSWSLI